jgi:integrase/recombinase XerC
MRDDIARFLAGIGQRSTHTVSAYRRDLLALASHAAEAGLRDWAEIDAGHLSGFIATCHRRGLGGRSLQRRLSAIRAFYRHLERAGRVSRNPAEGLRAPKAQKRLPEVLDVDQSARLMGIPGTDPLAVRDRALLELVYSSGLRVSEAVGLDLADLDLVEREVRVTGKGQKRRIVPSMRAPIVKPRR